MEKPTSGLPIFSKLMFYGLCGFFVEIMFNGTWYFFDSNYNFGWTLHGTTSMWSFPIYSACIFAHEMIYKSTKDKLPIYLRAILYVLFTFTWEYTTGSILRYFNACPWNYTDYTYYNLHGLITFDYTLFWYLSSMFSEKYVIETALSLQYQESKVKV